MKDKRAHSLPGTVDFDEPHIRAAEIRSCGQSRLCWSFTITAFVIAFSAFMTPLTAFAQSGGIGNIQDRVPGQPPGFTPRPTQLLIGQRRAIVKLPFHEFHREITYEIIDDRAIYQGDIDLGLAGLVQQKSEALRRDFESGIRNVNLLKLRDDTQFIALKEKQMLEFDPGLVNPGAGVRSAVLLDPQFLWTGGIVPFEIKTNDFTASFRQLINDAIEEIEANTVVRFRTRTGERDYIEFVKTNNDDIGGSSPVGRDGRRQRIRLNPDNISNSATIIHEIFHSLGLYHTQSRADRNQNVCVFSNNIRNRYEHNFDIHDGEEATGIFGPYNTSSVMHYSSCAFSSCESSCSSSTFDPVCTTLTQRTGSGCVGQIIANRSTIPQSDWDAINFMYDQNGGTSPGPGSPKTISVTIERVVTTAGPEENGVGCNDKMDYKGNIALGVLRDIAVDPYGFVQRFDFPIDKTEGNDLRPDWRGTFLMQPNDRFGLVQIRLVDDDKKGAVGIGACGKEDDVIDISSLEATTLQLVVEPDADQIFLSQTTATIPGIGQQPVFDSTTHGVIAAMGESFSVEGNSGSHRARVTVKVTAN